MVSTMPQCAAQMRQKVRACLVAIPALPGRFVTLVRQSIRIVPAIK
jgi:hypothetical protein